MAFTRQGEPQTIVHMTNVTVHRSSIRTTAVRVGAGLVAGAVLVGLAAGGASAAPAMASPAGFNVTRTGADATMLHIVWKAVPGAARYTVNIFDGINHLAYNVGADQTSFDYHSTGNCTRYRISVAAVDKNGIGSATKPTQVSPLAPGGITNLNVDRGGDGSAATLSWAAPAAGGSFEPVSSYRVNMRSLATGETLVKRDSADAAETVKGLDPARSYVAEIVPTNRFGSCAPSKILVRGPEASKPTNLKVTRDTNDANLVNISWTKPTWTGYGAITQFQLGIRGADQRTPTWTDMDPGASSTTVKLDSKKRWSIWVRAVGEKGITGENSVEYKLDRSGVVGELAADPKVHVAEAAGVVRVTFNGPVGSSALYPKMNVAIAPSATDTGFGAKQDVWNRAQTFTFDQVPCGAYTVVVTGYGADVSKEFGRLMINRCNTGVVDANQWKLVTGHATITDNAVDDIVGGEARTISTLGRTSPDMVYATDATLRTAP